LGELEQIANKAGSAFIRGGRAATALGLSLTSQQIRARAAELAGKDLNDELTQFELFAGGASLASEQFGDSVQENIAKALENPVIALERLKEIFGDTLEEFGKPLIAPIFNVIEKGLPAVLAFSQIMADLALLFLPAVTAIVELAAPAFTEMAGRVSQSIQTMRPAFESVAEAAALVTEAFLNIAVLGLEPALIIMEGFALSLQLVAELLLSLGEGTTTAIIGLYLLHRAFITLQRTITLLSGTAFNPWIVGLGLAAVAAAGLFARMNEGEKAFDGLSDNSEQF
jgi:hypothetical protein